MLIAPKEVVVFRASGGRMPFDEWLRDLKDQNAVARVLARLGRVRQGNLGDCKSVGEGVSELRVDYGPGYRVYFGQKGPRWWCSCAAVTSAGRTKTSGARSNFGRSIRPVKTKMTYEKDREV